MGSSIATPLDDFTIDYAEIGPLSTIGRFLIFLTRLPVLCGLCQVKKGNFQVFLTFDKCNVDRGVYLPMGRLLTQCPSGSTHQRHTGSSPALQGIQSLHILIFSRLSTNIAISPIFIFLVITHH